MRVDAKAAAGREAAPGTEERRSGGSKVLVHWLSFLRDETAECLQPNGL